MKVSGQQIPPPPARGNLQAQNRSADGFLPIAGFAHTLQRSLTTTELYSEDIGVSVFRSHVTALSVSVSVTHSSGSLTGRIVAGSEILLDGVIDATNPDYVIAKGTLRKEIPALTPIALELESSGYVLDVDARLQVHLVNSEALPYQVFAQKNERAHFWLNSIFALDTETTPIKFDNYVSGSGNIRYDQSTGRFTLSPGTYLVLFNFEITHATDTGCSANIQLWDVNNQSYIPGASAVGANSRSSLGSCGTLTHVLYVGEEAAYEMRTRNPGANFRAGLWSSTNMSILRID